MKYVFQKYIAGHDTPDCFRAAIASILDLSVDEVPNVYPSPEAMKKEGNTKKWQMEKLDGFLNEKFKIDIMSVPTRLVPKDEYYVGIFAALNDNGYQMSSHAFVCKNDQIVHCPASGYFMQNGPVNFADYFKENPRSVVSENIILKRQ